MWRFTRNHRAMQRTPSGSIVIHQGCLIGFEVTNQISQTALCAAFDISFRALVSGNPASRLIASSSLLLSL